MTTKDFARWLKDRDLSMSRETLHHLWALGVLNPVVVLESALDAGHIDTNRFVPVDLGTEPASYLDLGVDVDLNCKFERTASLPAALANSLLWHPYQLWLMTWLERILSLNISLDTFVASPEGALRITRNHVERIPSHLVDFAQSDNHRRFIHLLALLISVEPLVHTAIDRTVSLRPRPGEFDLSLGNYYSWIDEQDGSQLLYAAGLSVEQAENWHHDLAVWADIEDPLAHFRILLRHADRRKRARMKGKALLAHNLYDAAEILRRYLERYHDRDLLEEDDAIHGSSSALVKSRLYGSSRTADFDRTVFRRIAREFDVDPQARTTWFLEGATEKGFVQRLAERKHIDLVLSGVEVMDLKGLGGLSSDRFRSLLERFQREEVFAYVSIDQDQGGEHLRLLRKYAADKLLPAGYTIWVPDFESANYTLDELAAIASARATDNGVPMTMTGSDILQGIEQSGKPAGKVIESLWRAERYYDGKGEEWGCILADWASDHACPSELVGVDGERPNVGLLSLLLTGQRSHYQATAEEFIVDIQGKLIPRTIKGNDSQP
jgi:hypothetical protein